MRRAHLLAVAASALLGVVAGVAGGLVVDRTQFDDPLGLDAPMVNQPCRPPEAVLVLVSGSDEGDLASDLATNPDARYLETARSCHTAWREKGKPSLPYAVYLGPFSRRDACEKQMTGAYLGSHVTLLAEGRPDIELCSCYVARAGIPILRSGQTLSHHEVVYLHDLQELLTRVNIRPDEPRSNTVDQETLAQVRRFQIGRVRIANGTVNADTWRALLRAGCGEG